MSASAVEKEIVIVGAGFGGLGLAIQLKRAGRDDFVVIDRADDVGGTWRDNTYPGVMCDVPSHLYCFSFRPNPDWSKVYAPGPEIQQYLRDCAYEEGLTPHLRLGRDLTDARWDGGSWEITAGGEVYRSRYLVLATGHLADAQYPDIPGIDTFPGSRFHSARWDHGTDLAGRRIGVVGTGASAIQIIPQMAEIGSEVVVFQRTPAYVIPRQDGVYTAGEKRLFARDPEQITSLRRDLFWGGENNFAQRRAVPRYLEAARRTALAHLRSQVADSALREVLTPRYEPGCKRILISNDYYPALQAPHVTVEPSALVRIDTGAAVAGSGNRYELDALVFATGFEATEPPIARLVHGTDGRSLSDAWSEGMEALDSISVHGFPNMFIINGPNTSLGHNSIVFIIESQVDYILGMLEFAEKRAIEVIEPTREAEAAYVDRVQDEARGTVWIDGGCKSWYVDQRSGKLTLIWPDTSAAFRAANGRFTGNGYTLRKQESSGSTVERELEHAQTESGGGGR